MKGLLLMGLFGAVFHANSAELKVGDSAPTFKTKTHANENFDLASRKGQWTVLYFYPKADTPGCTKQACAFRDGYKEIEATGASIYGVSADTVESQSAFHKKYKLNFTLLADADGEIIKAYGAKMPVVTRAKRWTFIIDPEIKIRAIEKDVDPVKDALKVTARLKELQKP